MRSKLLVGAVVVAYLVLAGLPAGGAGRVWALSLDDELEIGREFMAQVRVHFTLIEDDFVERYINSLGRYLTLGAETRPFDFHFYVIKDSTLNAFAAPGGQIFFFSGLIEALDQIDELAAVICHEIGHVTARHLSDRIDQNKKLGLVTLAGVLAGALLGGVAAEAIIAGTMAAGIQAQLHYSRQDERQADQLGYKYMLQSGFDPRGMETALKEIAKGSWLGSDKIPAYLLTHPTGPERMANLDSLLSGYKGQPSSARTEQFRAQYPFFRAVVRAYALSPQLAERLFKRELDAEEKAPYPHLGLGLLSLQRRDYPQAIEHFEKAIEYGKPFRYELLTYLGQAYQLSGRDQEAVRTLKEALAKTEDNKAALYHLGLSYINLGQYSSAAEAFERLASSRPPVKSEVYYQLGLAYGRLERLGLAHYNFGRYNQNINQYDKAQFHFNKAAELAGNDPVLAGKIQTSLKELDQRKP